MNCPECQTRNPIGSRFCRLCGTALAVPAGSLAEEEARQAELERAREQGAELLARAHRHLERHEVDAAIPLVEEAARLLPESTAAHSLLAIAYERAHRSDDAVRVMERVVELNPDSEVDRDKLDRLRRGVHFVPEIVAEPEVGFDWKRVLPWAAGAGAMILVLGVGSWLTRPNPPARTTSQPRVPPINPQVVGNPLASPTTPGNVTLLPTAPINNGDPFVRQNPPMNPAPPTPDPAQGANPGPSAPPVNPPAVGNALPGLGGNPQAGQTPETSIRPVPPVVIAPQGTANRIPRESISATPPPDGGQGGTIAAGPPAGGAADTTSAAPPGQRGYIRVEFHDKNNPSGKRDDDSNGSVRSGGPRPDPGGDPMLKAQAMQSAGKWREAIAWFRNAQFAGADPGECQQGIALCHQRLGEWDNARASYKRALDAFAKHRGTPRWRTAERGWNACRAALEVLGE